MTEFRIATGGEDFFADYGDESPEADLEALKLAIGGGLPIGCQVVGLSSGRRSIAAEGFDARPYDADPVVLVRFNPAHVRYIRTVAR